MSELVPAVDGDDDDESDSEDWDYEYNAPESFRSALTIQSWGRVSEVMDTFHV